jgi:PBP1b-binding outer membrane lipoprotein LpoB
MKTHSKMAVIAVLLMAVLFVLGGCDNQVTEKKQASQNESARMSLVSQRIGELKQAGLLDSLINQEIARNIAGTDSFFDDPNVDTEKLNLFIYNTDEALAEIAQEETSCFYVSSCDSLIPLVIPGGI